MERCFHDAASSASVSIVVDEAMPIPSANSRIITTRTGSLSVAVASRSARTHARRAMLHATFVARLHRRPRRYASVTSWATRSENIYNLGVYWILPRIHSQFFVSQELRIIRLASTIFTVGCLVRLDCKLVIDCDNPGQIPVQYVYNFQFANADKEACSQ